MRLILFILGVVCLFVSSTLLERSGMDLIQIMKVLFLQSVGVVGIFVTVFWRRLP
jgi:hypothetical protein